MYGTFRHQTCEEMYALIDQEQAFGYYFGERISYRKRYRNPLRHDKTPGCMFRRLNGKVYFIDFGRQRTYDLVDFVMTKYQLTFPLATTRIREDFNVSAYDVVPLPASGALRAATPSLQDYSGKVSSVIGINKRHYGAADDDYWGRYGLSATDLLRNNVYAVQRLYYGELGATPLVIYTYNAADPAYAYFLGWDSDGMEEWKVYFPYRKGTLKPRFYSNNGKLQGYSQLPPQGDVLLLTKSYKDVMLLRQYGIICAAPASEKPMGVNLAMELQERFRRIYTLFDFDYAGVTSANYNRKNYGFEPLFLTNGRFHTADYGAKDISDYRAAYGGAATDMLVEGILQQHNLPTCKR